MNKTIKVLLADTSDFFGVPCAAALRSHEMDVIQVEKDGRKLLERIEAERPDAVVLDFFLSGLDAVGVISQTKRRASPSPVSWSCPTRIIRLSSKAPWRREPLITF